MITKTKTESLSSLIKELDALISKYVRLTFADFRGICKCVCCDTVAHWTQMDCAHFISRSNMAARFYLPNLAPAAKACNQFDSANHLKRWSGKLTASAYIDLSYKAKSLIKWTRPELQEQIEFYKAEVKSLRKLKRL
jgi:hypothetical protein